DELDSLSPNQVIHPEMREQVQGYTRARLAGREAPARYELKVLTKSGETRLVDLSVMVIDYNDEPALLGAALDITERKRAEEALLESESLFKDLANNAPGMVYQFRIDADGNWTFPYVSPGSLQYYGFEPAEIVADPQLLVGAVHPEDRTRLEEAVALSLRENTPYTIIHRVTTKDGQIRWMDARSTPKRMPDGGTLWNGIAIDITERKQAEAKEREARRFADALADCTSAVTMAGLNLDQVLARILDHLSEFVPHTGSNIMLLDWEKEIARVERFCNSYAENRLPGPRLGEEIPLAERPILRALCQQNKALIVSDVLLADDWRHGEPSWIRSYAGAPIHINGQVLGVLNVDSSDAGSFTAQHLERLQAFADAMAGAIQNAQMYKQVTQQKSLLESTVAKRTAELRRSKEQVEMILHTSPDPILFLSPTGEVESVNPAVQAAFGYEADHLLRKSMAMLFTTDQWWRVKQALDRALTQLEVQRFEGIALREDGSTFDARLAFSPISGGQSVSGIVCTIQDVSWLTEVARMKDAFVSNVSHELRTPITSLKLNHTLMKMKPDRADTYMGRLEREIDRLNGLIEDLLRLSRLDQGRTVLDFKSVDLRALVTEYTHDRMPLAETREITLSLDEGGEDIRRVQADEGLIGQVLGILLTNAINYTPIGGQVMVSILSQLHDEVDWVGFRVRDSGPGIPPEDLPHVFERFFRGRAGRDSRAPGTGLGLSIADEIIRRHHGRIEVDGGGSGQGATFTVWLPARQSF
ncbi:MAG: PAS domain S-box protein, partial [Chloroflexi bacterium]|nr:PAS domain S-box protein [Chloroflexota bacterium]